jgi:hypothetical protein
MRLNQMRLDRPRDKCMERITRVGLLFLADLSAGLDLLRSCHNWSSQVRVSG